MADSPDQTCTTRKRQRSSDRISVLPDDIIVRILSFVSMEEAVATSILSKRWRPLWTLVPIIDLPDFDFDSSDIQELFIEFVRNVLRFNKAVSLEKLRIQCNPDYASDFFNRIKTLKVLKLGDGVLVDVPSGVSFPNLKTLHLSSVKYTDDPSVANLFSGCVVLEELLIKRIYSNDGIHMNISISTLKTLSIEYDSGLRDHSFEINAPALERLNLKDVILRRNYWMFRPVMLVHSPENANKLLRVFSGVKSLSFTVLNWPNELYRDCNPLFVNLVRLELNVGLKNWNLLLLFLENSHILQFLELTLSEGTQSSFGSRYENTVTLPKHVPICFLSSLETVCLRAFEESEHELQLIEYILTNARVLKTMTISAYDSLLETFLVDEKLSTIPRCSKTCQLEFKCQPYVPTP
ncbi:PREDICTED: F-box/FBD/LRR-repeat protein At4g00160 [Theobroma cacao]|uniref:F-box/FBD/LRR-repeat protein At4g00160 n=1 Tax=Theobroma cacao TaxID=3641 RepID=A0AB32WJZ7_THECC|nr:PREDICTED: F-box/FBD/LRR-repeat protein At4g00160 [Theobroma cacao]